MLSDFADGLILLPIAGSRRGRARGLPGAGAGSSTAAALWREGSASLPGPDRSGQRLRASDAIFGLVLAGGWPWCRSLGLRPPPALVKITAKYVLFLSPCQRWGYFWGDGRAARRCWGGRRGYLCPIGCPLTGDPPRSLFPQPDAARASRHPKLSPTLSAILPRDWQDGQKPTPEMQPLLSEKLFQKKNKGMLGFMERD